MGKSLSQVVFGLLPATHFVQYYQMTKDQSQENSYGSEEKDAI